MNAFILRYKGYLIHTAAIAVIFLTPSVQAAIAANPKWSALVGAAWGYLLHWANGK